MVPGIRKVCIVGAGHMGQQIATVSVLAGCEVSTFDRDPQAPAKAWARLTGMIQLTTSPEELARYAEARSASLFSDSLARAVDGADLVIEAVAEKLEVKREVFAQIDRAAAADAIIGSNSSSIPVSKIESAVAPGRRTRVANIHFDSPLLARRLVEVMPGAETSPETLEIARSWAETLGCVPVVVRKPIMGYFANRLWRAVKKDALKLWAGGYGDVRDIDRSWMEKFNTDIGPFAMMDVVGLDVVHDIEMAYYRESGDPDDIPPPALKEMIERDELGMKSGKGFYDWSHSGGPEPELGRKPQAK
ncbi:MAG: 3-hydroxyacyl-CoA dehydrogenase family protein [bacterium]